MAIISGTVGNDTIQPAGVSPGVTGGAPGSGFDSIEGSAGSDLIDGGGGFDVLSYATLAAQNPVIVTLTGNFAGTISKAGLGTDTISGVVSINGTPGADVMAGFVGQNTNLVGFAGLAGNDTINGANTSYNYADYRLSPAGVNLDFASGIGLDGYGSTDSLIGVARARGSAFNDTISGGGNFDFFMTSTGSDVFDGRGGVNNLTYAGLNAVTITLSAYGAGTVVKSGGQGTDTFSNVTILEGSEFADRITGMPLTAGPTPLVVLVGHGGNDTIDGASFVPNVLSYSSYGPTAGVAVNLAAGTASDGQGGTDTLIDVRAVQGSAFNDTITGTAGFDYFYGSGGSDSIVGGGGTDKLLYTNTAVGGSLGSITLNAGAGTVIKSAGGTDSFSGITSITGSSGADTFRLGSTAAWTVDGGGNTTNDALDYGNQPAILGINAVFSAAGSGTVTKSFLGGTAVDTFTNVRQVFGTAGADTLTGAITGGNSANLRGRAGDDVIDGKANTGNSVSYGDSTNGVTISLQDSIDGFGNVLGHAFDGWQVAGQPAGTYSRDTLINVVAVSTGAGNDTLSGSARSDFISASTAGNDVYDGRGAFDTISYTNLNGAGTINATFGLLGEGLFGWGNATVLKSTGFTDTLTSFNDIRGTTGNDTLTGSTDSYSWNSINLRGSAGNDVINGQNSLTNKADYLDAASAVTIDLAAGTAQDGFGGNDTLINVLRVRASGFNDTIMGGAGGDYIETGASGSHTFDGRGNSNRIVYTGTDNVTIDLGSGGIAAAGGFGGFVGSIVKAGGTDTLANFTLAIGGAGDDTIIGTSLNDTLSGGSGSNLIEGGGGANNSVNYRSWAGATPTPTQGANIDLLDGITGTALNPWGGTDALHHIQSAVGTQFDDTISGAVPANGGRSYIRGDGGHDLLHAAVGNSLVSADYAGALSGVTVDLKLQATSDDGWFGGTDTLENIQGVRGSAAADRITGGDLADFLEGAAGNDTLDGGLGTDSLTGGTGDDTYVLDSAADIIVEDAGEGIDTLLAGFNLTLAANLENLTFATGAGGLFGVGNELGNRLTGNEAANTLIGLAGDDTLDGGANPGGGGDVLLGGAGNDTYLVDSALDLIDEGNLSVFADYGFGGTDTIVSTANFFWDLYSIGETLVIAANAADPGGAGTTAVGSVFDNTMIGNAGTNILFGRGGADTYRAGDGIDYISLSTLGVGNAPGYVANGVNTVIVDPRTTGPMSYDIVFSFETGHDRLNVSAYHYGTAAAVLATGQDDGLGNSYFALGDGLDYLYIIGLTKAQIAATDFIV